MPHFTSTQNLTLHYRIHGRGRRIILLHAFLYDSGGYPQAVNIITRTHQVIAIDLPYHGQSSAPSDSPSISQITTLLHELINHFKLPTPILLGHSWGATIAAHYASKYPTHSLHLIEPVTYTSNYQILRILLNLFLLKPINDFLISPQASLQLNYRSLKLLIRNFYRPNYWKYILHTSKLPTKLPKSLPLHIYFATSEEITNSSQRQQILHQYPHHHLHQPQGNHDWLILQPQYLQTIFRPE